MTGTQKKLIMIGFTLTILILWCLGMTLSNNWSKFINFWPITLTMAFGSFIAGATTEGGGAVAFPILTLLFEIPPIMARDFAWMIQTIGMGTAAISILIFKTPLYKKVILPISLGGLTGLYPGITILAPFVPPNYCKIFFTSLWLSFGVWILIIEKTNKRNNLNVKNPIDDITLTNKNIFILFLVGLIGSQISSLTGTGLDLFSFSFLVLYFNLDPKKVTFTSIILMAVNSLFGFIMKISLGGPSTEAWSMWWVSVPIVIFGAPLGAAFIKNKSKNFVLSLLVTLIIIQFIMSYLIVNMNLELYIFSFVIFLLGFSFFFLVYSKLKFKNIKFTYPSIETFFSKFLSKE